MRLNIDSTQLSGPFPIRMFLSSFGPETGNLPPQERKSCGHLDATKGGQVDEFAQKSVLNSTS